MPPELTVLHIGEWRVDPNLDELSREGQTIRLEPRPMRLLLYLAMHAGRVVEVQELLNEIWPNTVVTQGSVYQAIAQLRRVLGDESDHPKYIENLPRRGYRLIAPVGPWNRCATAADISQPAAQNLTRGSDHVGAEPQLAAGAAATVTTPGVADSLAVQAITNPDAATSWTQSLFRALGAILAVLLAYFAIDGFWISQPRQTTTTSSTDVAVEPVVGAFTPPPHSIAVLPFVNISGDKEQEYFSDGLTEELLNSLSRINELQVAARTSSFYFKGKNVDLATIAHKLNVGSVLEGSVRRSGSTIRITAQLNNAVTGFHVWSQTYDRDVSDVLQLQTDIANAVADALEIRLLNDVTVKIELGGTRNPAAFDEHLRASKAYREYRTANDLEAAIPLYTEAIRLDPDYALAYSDRALAQLELVTYWVTNRAAEAHLNTARSDARKAITLAPDLADGHRALAIIFARDLDFRRAGEEFERAVALDPGNAHVLQSYGQFAVNMGHIEAGLAALRRAVALDPLHVSYHATLAGALRLARRYTESLAAQQELQSLLPDNDSRKEHLFDTKLYYAIGNFQKVRSLCDSKLTEGFDVYADRSVSADLAVCYYPNVSRDADARAALKQYSTSWRVDGAYDYAKIYAQWGETAKALEWMETAARLRAADLQELKVEPFLDPLRKEPRFQVIERKLQFPN